MKALALIILLAPTFAFANNAVDLDADNITLADIVKSINAQGGKVSLNPLLATDRVSLKYHGPDWGKPILELLPSYQIVSKMRNGKLVSLDIQDRNAAASSKAAKLATLSYSKPKNSLNDGLASMASSGALYEVIAPIKELKNVKLGEKVILNLPHLDVEVLHDSRTDYADGMITWIGYINGDKNSRTIITSNADGSVVEGKINTASEDYVIHTIGRKKYIIDTLNPSVNMMPMGDDVAVPLSEPKANTTTQESIESASGSNPAGKLFPTAEKTELVTSASAVSALATKPRVDLEVLVPNSWCPGGNATIIESQIIALSNQAYTDSGINGEIYPFITFCMDNLG